jgi:F0F1-type ATP synthase membrane subunit b/b'
MKKPSMIVVLIVFAILVGVIVHAAWHVIGTSLA